MEINQLNYLLETIKTKSVSIAAKNCDITQSALSKSLKSLEKELQIPLLERDFSGMILSKECEQLLPSLNQLNEKMNLLSNKVQDFKINNNLSTQLNIYLAPAISQNFSLKIFFNLIKNNPTLFITFFNSDVNNVINYTKNKNIDLSFFLNINNFQLSDITNTSFNYIPIFNQKFLILTHRNSLLASKPSINLKELEKHKLIIPNFGFEPVNFIQQIFNSFYFKNIMKCSNTLIINKMIEENLAVALVSNHLFEDSFSNNYLIKPIDINNNYLAEIGCLYDVTNPSIDVIEKIINLILSK